MVLNERSSTNKQWLCLPELLLLSFYLCSERLEKVAREREWERATATTTTTTNKSSQLYLPGESNKKLCQLEETTSANEFL